MQVSKITTGVGADKIELPKVLGECNSGTSLKTLHELCVATDTKSFTKIKRAIAERVAAKYPEVNVTLKSSWRNVEEGQDSVPFSIILSCVHSALWALTQEASVSRDLAVDHLDNPVTLITASGAERKATLGDVEDLAGIMAKDKLENACGQCHQCAGARCGLNSPAAETFLMNLRGLTAGFNPANATFMTEKGKLDWVALVMQFPESIQAAHLSAESRAKFTESRAKLIAGKLEKALSKADPSDAELKIAASYINTLHALNASSEGRAQADKILGKDKVWPEMSSDGEWKCEVKPPAPKKSSGVQK